MTNQNQAQFKPIRRSAMHHKHLERGASMVERDGWQQPSHFGSVQSDSKLLLEAVGLCDISPLAKFVIKGDQLDQFISRVFQASSLPEVGEISLEDHSGEKAALCRLAGDEILCLAPAGLATAIADKLTDLPEQCAHALDISSGLAGIGVAGPHAGRLLGMISELNTSDSAFPNLRCAQSKFADIHGTLLRVDIGGLPAYQLYFGREFGEYLWEAMLEASAVCGGGPVGFEAIDHLKGTSCPPAASISSRMMHSIFWMERSARGR